MEEVPFNQDMHPDALSFLKRVLEEHREGVREADIVMRADLEGAAPEEQLGAYLKLYALACGEKPLGDESERSTVAAAALILATKYPAIEHVYNERFGEPGFMAFDMRQERLKKMLQLPEKAAITWAGLKKRLGF